MKKIHIIFAVIAITTIAIAGKAYSGENGNKQLYTIKDSQLTGKDRQITGKLPQFTGIKDRNLQEKLNKTVDTFYDEIILSSDYRKNKERKVSFSYSLTGDEKYLSVVMHGSIFYGNNGSDDVKTIVLDRNSYIFKVVEALECPSLPDTVLTSMPPAI